MDEAALSTRLSAIEQQLARVSQHLGIDCPPFPGLAATPGGMPADVVELARAGNLIGAIKRYREHTGVGLAEAKAAVERIS